MDWRKLLPGCMDLILYHWLDSNPEQSDRGPGDDGPCPGEGEKSKCRITNTFRNTRSG